MTHLNPEVPSLLKPVIKRLGDYEERLYTLRPIETYLKASSRNVQFYVFDQSEESSFHSIEKIPGTISAMSPLECFEELCTRFPAANPGCRRVFLIGRPWFFVNGQNKPNQDLQIHYKYITSYGMPHQTEVVVFPDDIYDGTDIEQFRDLVVRCGSFPTTNESILQYNEDTNFMWSKGVYSPGNLKMALYDHDGRIAKRRNTLKTRKHGITLEYYSRVLDLHNHTEKMKNLLEEELKRIHNIRVRRQELHRFSLPEVVFKKWGPHQELEDFFTQRSYYSCKLPKAVSITNELRVHTHFNVGTHLGNLHVFESLYDGALVTLMRRSSKWPQFRHHLLVSLLHLTEPLATIRYLSSEVAPPGNKGLTEVMNACFAVARLIRTLSPTRQEILNVRSQHAEPDHELIDAACDHLRRTGQLYSG